jgi:hypothetical protein
MHIPLFGHTAKRQTVSATVKADLAAGSSVHGLNSSRIAESKLLAAPLDWQFFRT